MPGHELAPFLVTPKASCTLLSVGSQVEGGSDCYTFFDKHAFKISGMQVIKDENDKLKARFVGNSASHRQIYRFKIKIGRCL